MQVQEYNFVKLKVRNLMGLDLDCYKSAQMQRRLGSFLLRSGHSSWPSLFRAIQDDPMELSKLKNHLTINVSAFFRDPQKYEYLRTSILPRLLKQRPTLRVWSAGCSRGHEPYSLAMTLAEATSPFNQHTILATDIDRSALLRARAGGPYSATDVANVPPSMLECNFSLCFNGTRDDGYSVSRSLQRKVTFQHHNLLQDPFESDFDLIVCRNVVIYFVAEVKNLLYRRFYDALRPGGVLFVGGTEVISKTASAGFKPVGVSFYRRNGTG